MGILFIVNTCYLVAGHLSFSQGRTPKNIDGKIVI